MKETVERFHPDVNFGLTKEQIETRISDDLVHHDTTIPTKTIRQILFENFFTLFNILNLILGILVFSVGSYKNMLFLFIVIINTAISTVQELYSKRAVDKLSIVTESKANVIRDGKKEQVSIYDLLLDDIMSLKTGNQIPTDCIVKSGEIVVNESFITGEPNSITKKPGDMILSGSYIVIGSCFCQVEHIGEDNYSSKISKDAKYIKKLNSEIMSSLKKIIKLITFIIIPVGLLMFYTQSQLDNVTYQDAVIQTVAAIIGMIPEGLVLLTSTVLAVSVIRLSRAKVLVQELYCIETLARVDTLCLDKTGTLTENTMDVVDYIPIENSKDMMYEALANISNYSEDENATMLAIKYYFHTPKESYTVSKKVPFSSEKKWSGVSFEAKGSYVLGAPEFVLGSLYQTYQKQIEGYTADYRVLVLAHSDDDFQEKDLPTNIKIVGLLLLIDTVKKNAKTTLAYFKKQGVDIKIISGDNPITVSKIAKQVGVAQYDSYIDMSTIDDTQDLRKIVKIHTIFGRVSPMQKKELIIALKENGKTVAMTGDGVNDVLALRESDCSIAMANGSDVAKNISQLILIDSDFSAMPKVVEEGRRTINNIQRSASLFLVKTIYSTMLAFIFLFAQEDYPFIPIQLTLISTITIGIPSFLLALEPNKERIKGVFLRNVVSKAFPTAITTLFNIVLITILVKCNVITSEYFSSLCVITTGFSSILLLFTLSRSRKSEHSKLPVSKYRFTLAVLLTILFAIGLHYFGWFFQILPLENMMKEIVLLLSISTIVFTCLNFLFFRVLKIQKYK